MPKLEPRHGDLGDEVPLVWIEEHCGHIIQLISDEESTSCIQFRCLIWTFQSVMEMRGGIEDG